MNEEFCDPETGECQPADLTIEKKEIQFEAGKEIIYIGDPMCSWCWGISKELQQLKAYFPQYKFTIVVGGLRPGGGDPWNDEMKGFLKHHWEEVTKRSGQSFGYKLFDREHFNYDTEPPCRAVVAGRKWISYSDQLNFYEAVTRKFYVENEDPGEDEFYRSICEDFSIPFDDFISHFKSDEAKKATMSEFQLNRQWGVTGYPTVLFVHNDELFKINYGYREFEGMKEAIEKINTGELTN